MNVDRLFDSLREEVRRAMPPDVSIKDIKFEGPLVVVYTDEYEKLSANDSVARTVAQTIHRRVDIRPDPAGLEDPAKVEEMIRSMIPEKADIFDINFLEETGEALVEAINPSEVVGKEGKLLKIENPEQYHFDPKRLLELLMRTILVFSKERKFVVCMNEEKTLNLEMFEKAERICRAKNLLDSVRNRGGFEE